MWCRICSVRHARKCTTRTVCVFRKCVLQSRTVDSSGRRSPLGSRTNWQTKSLRDEETNMYTGLYAAVSGSLAHEKRLAILTNNLANANTVGFKADWPVFQVEPLPNVVRPLAV